MVHNPRAVFGDAMLQDTPNSFRPNESREFPVSEIARALGFPFPARSSYNDGEKLALQKRLEDVCVRCAIRFGIPEQVRKHVGDSLGLPDVAVLRNPHPAIPIDPRWETLANALCFSSTNGESSIATLQVANTEHLRAIKDGLASLLIELDLDIKSPSQRAARSVFTPIDSGVGDLLKDRLEIVRSYGHDDPLLEPENRCTARVIYRQMQIYKATGPEWTLVDSIEAMALVGCAESAKNGH